jgi:hypothetical protein
MRYLVLNHRIVIALVGSRGSNKFSLETEALLETLRQVGTLTLSTAGQAELGFNLGITVPEDHFQVEVYIFTPNEGAFLPSSSFDNTVVVEVCDEVSLIRPFFDKSLIRELGRYGLSVA